MNEHAAWMRFRRSQMLHDMQGIVTRLECTRSYGWEEGYPCSLADLIERLRGLMPPSAETAPTCTDRQRACQNTAGFVPQPPSNPDGNTLMEAGRNHSHSAIR